MAWKLVAHRDAFQTGWKGKKHVCSYCSCSENNIVWNIYISDFNVHEEIFQHHSDLLVQITKLEDRGRISFLLRPVLGSKGNVFCLYLRTYSIVQSPSWEANWFADSQEIPRISRKPKGHYRTHKRPPPVSILAQPNPVHIPTFHLLEIRPNIIHPSKPRSPQRSPSLRFLHQDPIDPLSLLIRATLLPLGNLNLAVNLRILKHTFYFFSANL